MARPADFLTQVKRRRDAAAEFVTGKPAKDRKEALQFYRGDNLSLYGDSGDGLSTVVSRDTMEAIESMMPPLLRPFVAGEEVVSFDPIGSEDEDSAKQATEYVNHCFRRGNNVLHVAQSALKDGLLFRLGVAKTVLEEVDGGPPETFNNVTQAEFDTLTADQLAGPAIQDPVSLLYTVTLKPKKAKRFRVHVIAPDEFLYEERLASMKEGSFFGHRKQMRVSDLIAAGIDENLTRRLTAGDPGDGEERDERYREEDSQEQEWSSDDPARLVWVDECYILTDYDGNGAPQWRKVLLGGGSSTLLSNEPVDDHPYSAWTPIPVPHKLVGLSIADLTRDTQMQRTAIRREGMNALYLANRPMREVVSSEVNIDDLLTPSVGGVVRVKQVGMIREIPSGGTGVLNNMLAMDEVLAGEREARTGVTRYNQGMDANSLNKTATGMNIIANNSQQRQELVARQFGEFLKDIFEKLLGLVSQHADEADVVKLCGSFVPWPTDYDTTVSVGLGSNNKDQLVSHMMALAQMHEKIIQLQGGAQGPLVTLTNVHEVMKQLTSAMGLKGNDRYFTDPEQAQAMLPPPGQQEPQGPSPDAQLKAQTELAKEDKRTEREMMKQQANVFPIDAGIAL